MFFKYFIGFDFGIKNIGVSIGQNFTYTAKPLNSLKAINGIPKYEEIKKIFEIWNPKIAIIGMPYNMDGTYQNSIAFNVNKFSIYIKKKFNINTKFFDERLTTIEARSKIFIKYGYKALKKNNIDSESASIILENWLIKMSKKSIL